MTAPGQTETCQTAAGTFKTGHEAICESRGAGVFLRSRKPP
jgi:hypothetical protein